MGLLDLADRSLSTMSKKEQLSAALSNHRCQHILYPPFVERKNDLPNLIWNRVPFSLASRKQIPKERGVYAFAVEFSDMKLPPSTHILYIGKAGDLNSNNDLWTRYYDYIKTERRNDRPRIHQMLNQWKGFLTYFYATVDQNTGTADIEETLLDIFIPPYNRGDFSAELSSLLKGANLI
jgi:hypothetical protein